MDRGAVRHRAGRRPPKNLSAYLYLKRYNFEKTNTALDEVSEAIRKNDTDVIRGFIDKSIPGEMKETKIGRY